MGPLIDFGNTTLDSTALLSAVMQPNSSLESGLIPHVPLLHLIQSYIENAGSRQMEFLEEARLPLQVLNYLKELGLEPGQQSFFLDDRTPFRFGILLVRSMPGDRPLSRNRQLAAQMHRFIKDCGWSTDHYRVDAMPRLDILPNRFLNQEMACLVVWRAQALPGEALPVNSYMPMLKADWLEQGDRKISIGQTEKQTEVVQLTTEATAVVQLPTDIPELVAVDEVASSKQTQSKPAADLPLAMSAPASALSESDASPLRHFVLGHSRNGLMCKYFLRRDADRLRLSVLTAPDLSAEFLLAFFDKVQYSQDIMRAHRDALQAAFPARVHSFSLEILNDGRFRAIVHGMRPLIWRQSERKATRMPDTTRSLDKEGRRQIKQVRGRIGKGDAIIFLPAQFADQAMLPLLRDLRAIGNLDGQLDFRNCLTDWLDQKDSGRAMMIDHHALVS